MKRLTNFLNSFVYAINGISYTISSERNMKIHIGASIIVTTLGFVIGLTSIEWLFIVVAISVVLLTECINTAMECAIDLTTTDIHPLAKHAKDAAAGAVLIASITAFTIGAIIFIPKFKGALFGS